MASQIPVTKFLNAVEQNYARVRDYKYGHDGSDGLCDCVGLVIGAIRLCGVKYTRKHGSNYFARYMMSSFFRISSVSQLKPGMLIYKALAPGTSGYNLPPSYSGHKDRNDYCHIGVVTSVNPLRIMHVTTVNQVGGGYTDTKIGKWKYAGVCSWIDMSVTSSGSTAPSNSASTEGKEVLPLTNIAIVTASEGKSVKMRNTPSTKERNYEDIPVGESVTVIEDQGEWTKIAYGTKTGYMMSKFLKAADATMSETYPAGSTASIAAGQTSTAATFDESLDLVTVSLGNLRIPKSEVFKIYNACAMALGLGVG